MEVNSGGDALEEADIERGIFQGDSRSLLLFVSGLISKLMILNETKLGYKLGKNREKINHLLFINDLKVKLYTKSRNELDSLVQTVRMFSEHRNAICDPKVWHRGNEMGKNCFE